MSKKEIFELVKVKLMNGAGIEICDHSLEDFEIWVNDTFDYYKNIFRNSESIFRNESDEEIANHVANYFTFQFLLRRAYANTDK